MLGPRADALSVYILFAGLLVDAVTSLTVCPTQCACHDVTVHCRFRSLTDVADVVDLLPPEVVELDLGDNEDISAINRTSFPLLTRLRRLRLDGCRLDRIQTRTFENLRTNLELLDLSGNAIRTIESGAFDGLQSLRRLRLDGNRLTDTGLPESTFRGLVLSELRLDSNRLETISGSVFVDAGVTSLNLDDNQLSSFDAAALQPLRQTLRSLSISGNRHSTLRIASDAFHNFMFRDLTLASSGLRSLAFLDNVASVENLDVGGNPLGVVELSWSSGLALSCLEARLAAINLTSVADAHLSSFRSARRLDLSANRISGTLDVSHFRSVPDLRHLDLSRNAISRLPNDLGIQMSLLDTLNLSVNSLTDLNAAAFSRAARLSVLDVSHNRIQVLEEPLIELFSALTLVGVAGNPLHCNCELRWFRRWMSSNGARQSGKLLDSNHVLCSSPSSMAGPLAANGEADFNCRTPQIVRITPSLVANETSNVMLSCLAEGDPAPEVVLRSPNNDRMGVSPPPDRKQTRTYAFWQLRNLRIVQSGWYSCNASNVAGSRTGYTYIHVTAPGDSPVDLSNLEFPMIPQPIVPHTGSTTGSMTSLPATSPPSTPFQFSVTSSSRNSTSIPLVGGQELSSTSAPMDSSTHTRMTQETGSTFSVALTTVPAHDPTEGSAAVWKKMLLIAGSVFGAVILLIMLFIVVICCVRYGRMRRRRAIRTKRVPPAPMPVREDRIRRPKPFPGVSMAPSAPDGRSPTSPLPALPVSPTYGRPERLDLLAAEYDRNRGQFPTSFDRRNGNGTNGCGQLLDRRGEPS